MPPHITREDLEERFRSVQESIQGRVDDQRSNLIAAAAIGGGVLVVAAYLMGRRAGRRTSPVVEIRRS